MMGSLLKSERLRITFLATASLALIYWLATFTVFTNSLCWSNWAYSEWLVNYSGGFVRRGFFGHIFLLLSKGKSSLYWVNTLVFMINSASILLSALVLALERKITTMGAVLYFLLPISLLHEFAIGQYFYRKESIFIIPVLLMTVGFKVLQRSPNGRLHKIFFLSVTLVSGLLGAVCELTHETYFLNSFPAALIIFFAALSLMKINNGYNKPLLILLFVLPTVFCAVISLLARGTPLQVDLIWRSLNETDRGFIGSALANIFHHPPFYVVRQFSAISELGSTAWKEGPLFVMCLLDSYAGFWILAFAATMLQLAAWQWAVISGDVADLHLEEIWRISLAIFCLTLPVYVFSEDWGRFIVNYGKNHICLLLVLMSTREFTHALAARKPFTFFSISKILATVGKKTSSTALLFGLIAWSLIFSMPECCIKDFSDRNVLRFVLFKVFGEKSVTEVLNRSSSL